MKFRLNIGTQIWFQIRFFFFRVEISEESKNWITTCIHVQKNCPLRTELRLGQNGSPMSTLFEYWGWKKMPIALRMILFKLVSNLEQVITPTWVYLIPCLVLRALEPLISDSPHETWVWTRRAHILSVQVQNLSAPSCIKNRKPSKFSYQEILALQNPTSLFVKHHLLPCPFCNV